MMIRWLRREKEFSEDIVAQRYLCHSLCNSRLLPLQIHNDLRNARNSTDGVSADDGGWALTEVDGSQASAMDGTHANVVVAVAAYEPAAGREDRLLQT